VRACSAMYLAVAAMAGDKIILCLADSGLGRRGFCHMLIDDGTTQLAVGERTLLNDGATAHVTIAQFPGSSSSAVTCFPIGARANEGCAYYLH
jgi:hypothetical protein